MDKFSAMTTFAKVVETGSFTRAADVLALPKARVSQRVSDLERHLGVRLLNRTTRSLNLTEDGQAYFAKCQVILQEIDELEGALKGGSVEPRGKLRVEALVSVARWVIAPSLHEFQARYPNISVRLGGSDRISHLLDNGIDCAIRGGHLEDSSQIARHVCDVHLGLYAAPAYLEAAGAVTHPQELSVHRRISWFTGQRNPLFGRCSQRLTLSSCLRRRGCCSMIRMLHSLRAWLEAESAQEPLSLWKAGYALERWCRYYRIGASRPAQSILFIRAIGTFPHGYAVLWIGRLR